MPADRIIGRYTGGQRGPLFICIGAMHGNEPAGVQAIDLVLKMLEVEPIRNPDFIYQGRFLGLIGNLAAYNKGVRFLSKDLNRNFQADHLKLLKNLPDSQITSEDREFIALDKIIRQEIREYEPSQVILLDLHTTSSYGGIFTICRDIKTDLHIAEAFHAPIVLGMLEGLQGTSLHYFTTEHMGVETIPITFESGQHQEPLAINRAVAGIINCMERIGSVATDSVENHHEEILISYSKNLPKVTQLLGRHAITEKDDFRMKPGYSNFQKVEQGEIVAEDARGPVAISQSGRILMPLYQIQGEEGFFLVKDLERGL